MAEMRTWTADEARQAVWRALDNADAWDKMRHETADAVLAALGISGDVTVVATRPEPAHGDVWPLPPTLGNGSIWCDYDWGGCSGARVALRFSRGNGWLPVCAEHRDHAEPGQP